MYIHLTLEEKYQIKALLESGLSCSAIALQLNRSASTISREKHRGLTLQGHYSPIRSTRLYQHGKRLSGVRRRRLIGQTWRWVRNRLKDRWSPEQIAGRYRLQTGRTLSHTTIYRRLWSDKDGIAIRYYLRHKGKRYRYGSAGRSVIPGRVDIAKRPAIAEEKQRIGDWEADTVWGKGNSGALVTLVDRASKYTLISKTDNKTAQSTKKAILAAFNRLKTRVQTITYDNGVEFSKHQEINAALNCRSYFAKPYSSWQRGLNEHTNGLIRQWLPKGTDFTYLTNTQCKNIQNYLNNRPRKCLNYNTPAEVFFHKPPVHFMR